MNKITVPNTQLWMHLNFQLKQNKQMIHCDNPFGDPHPENNPGCEIGYTENILSLLQSTDWFLLENVPLLLSWLMHQRQVQSPATKVRAAHGFLSLKSTGSFFRAMRSRIAAFLICPLSRSFSDLSVVHMFFLRHRSSILLNALIHSFWLTLPGALPLTIRHLPVFCSVGL